MVISTPLQQFLQNVENYPNDIFLRQPFGGEWTTWTWQQAADESRRIATALHSLHLSKGSHIAILSKNCAHWLMADIAIMMA